MPDLANSQRTVFKATYVPTRAQNGPAPTARAMEKVAYVRSLSVQQQEWDRLAQHPSVKALTVSLPGEPNAPATAQTIPLVQVARNIVTSASTETLQKYAPALAAVPPDQLATLGQALVEERRATAQTANKHAAEIQNAHAREVTGLRPSLHQSLAWAVGKNTPAAQHLYNLSVQYAATPIAFENADVSRMIYKFISDANNAPQCTQNIVDGFLDRFRIEPVGRLHLERLEMTPVGIEHGELVHTVPLTPHETVNLSHREWSVTETTFETIVEDFFEGFSEQGVAEKNDISQAVSNESHHSSALDVNGSVSATYNGGAYSVTANAGVDYNRRHEVRRVH